MTRTQLKAEISVYFAGATMLAVLGLTSLHAEMVAACFGAFAILLTVTVAKTMALLWRKE